MRQAEINLSMRLMHEALYLYLLLYSPVQKKSEAYPQGKFQEFCGRLEHSEVQLLS